MSERRLCDTEVAPRSTPPSSAGVCSTCGRHVEKRYGGEGRYLPECADCWTRGWAEELAVANAVEEAAMPTDRDTDVAAVTTPPGSLCALTDREGL